jgi:drug/metabolite transporter superfamily protein YnfA
MPAPMPMPGPGLTGMPIQAGAQQVIIQQSNKGRVWRWFNGIFGIIFSLAMLWVSNFIRETWDVLGDEISKEIENLNFLEKTLIGDFVADVESMISTFSTIYTIVMIISVAMLVVSIIQFMNKPWGGKAFLGVAGLLLVVLLGAAIYEYTAINNLIDEVNEMDGDEDLENIEFMETPGFIGSACTSVCFLIFALLAFLGRPRSGQVVQLQM